MRILLSNDDGIAAAGLAVLERIARTLSDDIWIVAPAEEQSGASRSLTISRPIRLRQHDKQRFSVTGTPTDAVAMALARILPGPPDLVLSGVNRGANVGEDVSYSGTVAAAMEGALAGIRSISLSQRYESSGMGDAVTFEAAEAWGERVLRPLLDAPWPARSLVNVNFPPLAADAVKGVRVVPHGFRDYGRLHAEPRTDPRGFDYFWLSLGRVPHPPGEDTDLAVIEQGYVTVTPLQLDLTHHAGMAALAALY